MNPNYPKVTIIILNWNGIEDTAECLESLKYITYPNYEILLVDNGSTDESLPFFDKHYKEVNLIKNEKNLGFAEGNNVGIRRAIEKGTDFILMLNNDTVVDPLFLDELVNVLISDERIGIVGPTIYYYDKKSKVQFAGAMVQWNKGKSDVLRFGELDDGETLYDITEVDYVSGCALLARSELFNNIGYLNKDYFAYWEETDWCTRVKKASYRILYVPSSKIWHKGGKTSNKTTGLYEYLMARNMFWFLRQHSGKKNYLSFLVYFFCFRFWLLSSIIIIYHRSLRAFPYFIKGVSDGLRTYPKSQ